MTQLLKRKTVKELSEELFRIENRFKKFEEVIQNLNKKVETLENILKKAPQIHQIHRIQMHILLGLILRQSLQD